MPDKPKPTVPAEWLDSHRNPRVTVAECTLCWQTTVCFVFTDSAGYSTERLCERCLRAALEMVAGN